MSTKPVIGDANREQRVKRETDAVLFSARDTRALLIEFKKELGN
jgi:hypothetical protein